MRFERELGFDRAANKRPLLDEIAVSSSAFKACERIDATSGAALARSFAGHMLEDIGRVLGGSAIARFFLKGTDYRMVASKSLVVGLIASLYEKARGRISRLTTGSKGLSSRWREVFAGSRVSDYTRFLFRYESGVVFLTVFIPVELFSLQYLPRAVKYSVELVLLLMTTSLFLSALTKRRDLIWTELELPVAALIGVVAISAVVNSVPPVIAVAGLRALLQFYLLYFVVVQADFDLDWLKRFVLGLIGLAIVLALFGLSQKITGVRTPELLVDVRETTIEGRIISTFANPNNFGGFLLLVLPVAIALVAMRVGPGVRLIAGFGAVAMLPALMFTYSRSAWLGFAAALVVLASMLDRRLLLGLLIAAVAAVAVVPSVIDRVAFGLSSSYMAASAAGGRLLYWSKALEIFAMSPIVGAGPGRFGGAVAAVFGSPVHALVGIAPNYKLWVDSQIFQVLAELGLLGLAAFLWVPATFARNAIAFFSEAEDPFWKAVAAGATASVVGVVAQGTFVGVWETHQIGAFFWLVMAIVMSVAAKRERRGLSAKSRKAFGGRR
mgnify:CR=1 FL=1